MGRPFYSRIFSALLLIFKINFQLSYMIFYFSMAFKLWIPPFLWIILLTFGWLLQIWTLLLLIWPVSESYPTYSWILGSLSIFLYLHLFLQYFTVFFLLFFNDYLLLFSWLHCIIKINVLGKSLGYPQPFIFSPSSFSSPWLQLIVFLFHT